MSTPDGRRVFSHSARAEAREQARYREVVNAFAVYLPYSLATNNVRRRSYNILERTQKNLLNSLGPALPLLDVTDAGSNSISDVTGVKTAAIGSNPWGRHGFKARLYEMDDRVRRNADFLELIVQRSRSFLPLTDAGTTNFSSHSSNQEYDHLDGHTHAHDKTNATPQPVTPPKDVDQVRSTLKQFVRDWSAEGALERVYAYKPILTAVEDLFGHVPLEDRGTVRLLFPGCGLGRLPWEAAMQGFSSQGNEFSMCMLMASHFILNHTQRVHEHSIYPWVGSMCNWRSSNAVLQRITVPDVDPNALLSAATATPTEFNMVAGDFTRVYSSSDERGAWSAVCTVFFIDTARNIIKYLEIINHLLPIGGYWINLGPLLWHFEGSGPAQAHPHDDDDDDQLLEGSIELTLDEVLDLTTKLGFAIDRRDTMPRQSYTGNSANMLTYEYECEFWVARKVMDVPLSSHVNRVQQQSEIR